MARNIEIRISRHEATVICAALSTFISRQQQKCRWQTNKRQRTLRQRLATAITIGDAQEEHQLRQAIDHSQQVHDRYAVRAAGIGGLLEHIRKTAGITRNEKINWRDRDENASTPPAD